MAKELLMAYSALDALYMNGLIKQIEGEPAAAASEVASIQDPDETYVPLGPYDRDPKMFSYAYGHDPAVLVAKAVTAAGEQPSSCAYTLAAPEAGCGKAWKILARDIVLTYTDPDTEETSEVATNPYGVAQVGNALFLIDYDSRFIYQLGVNELNGLADGEKHELAYTPFDPKIGAAAGLPVTAKGQAIIAARDPDGNPFLFALYTDAVISPTTLPSYDPSWLIKIAIDPVYGIPSVVGTVNDLALNAQELIYIENFDGDSGLLIPALGGPQQYTGYTNGKDSKLELVRPFASGGMTKTILLTGDALANPPTAYDIRAVAAPPDVESNGPIFLLTGTMDTDYNQNWRLYWTNIDELIIAEGDTLSDADLDVAEEGTGSPGNYWDIYYENGTGSGAEGDRLWFLKGSPISITAISNPGIPNKLFDTGYAQGQIGGINVDSATLVSEVIKQAAKGVSLKRGLRGIARVAPPEEAEEEK
jgi:hypothetical protein